MSGWHWLLSVLASKATSLHVVQVDCADTGGHVQARAALDADRLQGHLLVAAAEEHVRANPDANRSGRRGAAIRAGESARCDAAWCEHQPDHLGFLREADIDTEFLDGTGVAFGLSVRSGEQAA